MDHFLSCTQTRVFKMYICQCIDKVFCVTFPTIYSTNTLNIRLLHNVQILRPLGFKNSYAFFKLVTDELSSQRASDAESMSISWRYHA